MTAEPLLLILNETGMLAEHPPARSSREDPATTSDIGALPASFRPPSTLRTRGGILLSIDLAAFPRAAFTPKDAEQMLGQVAG